MTPFYYVSMGPGGSANIFLEMFVNRNQKQEFAPACSCELFTWDDRLIPFAQHCDYIDAINKKFDRSNRIVDWAKHLDYLENIVDSARPKSIWIGTNLEHTLAPVKEHFGDRVITMSINYDDYEFIYERWVKWQIGWMLKRTDKKFSSYAEADDFCRTAGAEYFGYSIPGTKTTSADHVIDIQDIFDPEKFKSFLSDLGCDCSLEDWAFYKEYIENC